MEAVRQYFRDLKAIRRLGDNRMRLFLEYNRLCIKNVVLTKVFRVKSSSHKALGYTFHYDNFNSFFAMFTEIFIHRVYSTDVRGRSPRIIDCGANIGIAAIFFKWRLAHSEIVCFEPDPGAFALLESNVRGNKLSKVTMHRAAVGGKEGKATLHSFGAFSGSPGNTLHTEHATFTKMQKTTVPQVTVSSQGRIDLLKVDIEGAEGEVFDELHRSGALKNIQRINLEFHYFKGSKRNRLSSILHALEQNGFAYTINPDSLIGEQINEKDFNEKKMYVLIIHAFR